MHVIIDKLLRHEYGAVYIFACKLSMLMSQQYLFNSVFKQTGCINQLTKVLCVTPGSQEPCFPPRSWGPVFMMTLQNITIASEEN